MWIESMNSFEIQRITEGLQIDKAVLSTKIQSQMDKTHDFYMNTYEILVTLRKCTLSSKREIKLIG